MEFDLLNYVLGVATGLVVATLFAVWRPKK